MIHRSLLFRGIPTLAIALFAGLLSVSHPIAASGDDEVDNSEPLPATITGRVYLDSNNDGIHQTTEPGIPGVLITLTGTDDLGNPVKRTAHTGKVGTYRFSNLRPGVYTVTEKQPRGYVDGLDAKAGEVIPGSNKTDVIADIAIDSGQLVEKNNFGELPPADNASADPALLNLPPEGLGHGKAVPGGGQPGGHGGCGHGGCCRPGASTGGHCPPKSTPSA